MTQGKKERLLQKHRESNGLVDQINMDLTYAVCFNLANAVRRVLVAPYVVTAVCVCCVSPLNPHVVQYHQNGMFTEAINTYSLIVKNKQYPQSGRLRVNMGNIYYQDVRVPCTPAYGVPMQLTSDVCGCPATRKSTPSPSRCTAWHWTRSRTQGRRCG